MLVTRNFRLTDKSVFQNYWSVVFEYPYVESWPKVILNDWGSQLDIRDFRLRLSDGLMDWLIRNVKDHEWFPWETVDIAKWTQSKPYSEIIAHTTRGISFADKNDAIVFKLTI